MSQRGDLVTVVCDRHRKHKVVARFERGRDGWVLTGTAKNAARGVEDRAGRLSMPGSPGEHPQKPLEAVAAFGGAVEGIAGLHVSLSCPDGSCRAWARTVDGANLERALHQAVAQGMTVLPLRVLEVAMSQ